MPTSSSPTILQIAGVRAWNCEILLSYDVEIKKKKKNHSRKAMKNILLHFCSSGWSDDHGYMCNTIYLWNRCLSYQNMSIWCFTWNVLCHQIFAIDLEFAVDILRQLQLFLFSFFFVKEWISRILNRSNIPLQNLFSELTLEVYSVFSMHIILNYNNFNEVENDSGTLTWCFSLWQRPTKFHHMLWVPAKFSFWFLRLLTFFFNSIGCNLLWEFILIVIKMIMIIYMGIWLL